MVLGPGRRAVFRVELGQGHFAGKFFPQGLFWHSRSFHWLGWGIFRREPWARMRDWGRGGLWGSWSSAFSVRHGIGDLHVWVLLPRLPQRVRPGCTQGGRQLNYAVDFFPSLFLCPRSRAPSFESASLEARGKRTQSSPTVNSALGWGARERCANHDRRERLWTFFRTQRHAATSRNGVSLRNTTGEKAASALAALVSTFQRWRRWSE